MSITAFANQSNTLPVPRTPLVGRAAELAFARTLLLDDAVPVLSLTGPGGVGKTRFALTVAHGVADSFADGVFFIDLSAIRDPALVLPTIAEVLDLQETSKSRLIVKLTNALHARQVLLVLDNFEQVLAAAPDIAALLATCPALQVLATSRAPLRIRGEHLLPVSPLAVPDATVELPPATLGQVDAVALFVARARAIDPKFALSRDNASAVAAVCRRLDGLPLAIELAAARLLLLTPVALLALLERRTPVLTTGARDLPDRQRTLWNTIAWSYELLGDVEKVLFRRLAVFVGGCTFTAAQAVSMHDGDERLLLDRIGSLIDQSLLREVGTDREERRFGMLETIREFGLERLAASGEEQLIRSVHAAHVVAIAELHDPGPSDPHGPAALDHLEGELGNIRAALAWLAENHQQTPLLRLATAMGWFWAIRGPILEGREWLSLALSEAVDAPPLLRAKALLALSWLILFQGDDAEAAVSSVEALHICRAHNDPIWTGWALFIQATIARRARCWEQAEVCSEESIALLRSRPAERMLAGALFSLGRTALGRGDLALAETSIEEALALQRRLGDVWLMSSLCQLGEIRRAKNDRIGAARLFGESLDRCVEVGAQAELVDVLLGLAALADNTSLTGRAARLAAAATAIGTEIDYVASSGIFRSPSVPSLSSPIDSVTTSDRVDGVLDLARDTARTLAAPDLPELPLERRNQSHKFDGGVTFGLTQREREVLTLLCQRQTDPEIAQTLFISFRTVNTHVTNIFNKLGVNSRRAAAAFAARHGLV